MSPENEAKRDQIVAKIKQFAEDTAKTEVVIDC